MIFDILGMQAPDYLPLWQVVGMFVVVYAPAYWWAARFPERYPQLIVIGMLGKVLGPLGFAWAVLFSDFPGAFAVAIVANDLIWYPAFLSYLGKSARERGGWARLLLGE